MANKKVEKNNTGAVVAIGAGIAAIGAIGYMLLGPSGKKNQKKVKSWALKMKGEVLEKVEKLEEVTAPIYEKVVNEIEEKYKKIKDIDMDDLKEEIDHLKNGWNKIVKQVQSKKSPAKKTVKKVATKVAKKAVKKATK